MRPKLQLVRAQNCLNCGPALGEPAFGPSAANVKKLLRCSRQPMAGLLRALTAHARRPAGQNVNPTQLK